MSQKVLVAGSGKSGIAAAKLLLAMGGEVVLYDGNDKLDPEKIKENFEVEKVSGQVRPQEKGTFGMYLEDGWYVLKAKENLYEGKDAVGRLDVAVLQDYLLNPVLGIQDPRTDERIEFIGGIRGLSELEKKVKEGMKVSFSMYPTSITELFDVADQNLLMPPKSTWFEPKLRSGLFIHQI